MYEFDLATTFSRAHQLAIGPDWWKFGIGLAVVVATIAGVISASIKTTKVGWAVGRWTLGKAWRVAKWPFVRTPAPVKEFDPLVAELLERLQNDEDCKAFENQVRKGVAAPDGSYDVDLDKTGLVFVKQNGNPVQIQFDLTKEEREALAEAAQRRYVEIRANERLARRHQALNGLLPGKEFNTADVVAGSVSAGKLPEEEKLGDLLETLGERLQNISETLLKKEARGSGTVKGITDILADLRERRKRLDGGKGRDPSKGNPSVKTA